MNSARIVRTLLSAALSFTVTALLVYGMRTMIMQDDVDMEAAKKGPVIDFVRLKRDESVQKKKVKPKKPPVPQEPPPPMEQPQLAQNDAFVADGAGLNFDSQLDTAADLSGAVSVATADGDYLPLVPVAAMYPARARKRGIEGWAIVEFTVTASGTTINHRVVDAQPQGVFNQSSLKAAAKLKYKPRVENGKPVSVDGVQFRFTFELDG